MIESPSQQTYQSTQRYLFSVAYRMTGSASESEDLVHEAWVRYLDAGSPNVNSLRAYLTTVVSRLALDYLKSARIQREQYVGPWLPEPILTEAEQPGPEDLWMQREDVSYAVLTLLDRLKPEQRIVYVLREGFGLSYDEIATHVDKTATTCRQIYRRAQKQLAAVSQPPLSFPADYQRIVEQFLVAVKSGDIPAVKSILAENVTWVGDGGAHHLTARRPITGRDKVARGMIGWAAKFLATTQGYIEIAQVNGSPALVQRSGPAVNRVLILDVRRGEITSIYVVVNPAKLQHVERAMHLGAVVS